MVLWGGIAENYVIIAHMATLLKLIEDIQVAATNPGCDVATLLLKCRLVAAHIESKEAVDWIRHESDGYPASATVPDYRVSSLALEGFFHSPVRALKNAHIPITCIPAELRDSIMQYQHRMSIGNIEDYSKSSGDTIYYDFNFLAPEVGTNAYEGMNCLQVKAKFNKAVYKDILHNVRVRILDFSLMSEKDAPRVNEEREAYKFPAKKEAGAKVVQHFYGDVGNVGNAGVGVVGDVNNSTIASQVITGNYDSLKKFFAEKGISEDDLDALDVAMEAHSESVKGGLSTNAKLREWYAEMIRKAKKGIWKVAADAATNILAQGFAKFFGE